MRALIKPFLLIAALGLAACSDAPAITEDAPKADLGRFSLGHNIVIADGMQQAPFSRKATEEEVEEALQAAIAERFGRYDGEGLYHIGIKVDAYGLATPGVPVVFTPKSVLVITVNFWDDSLGRKVHEKPKLMTVFESLSGDTIVGSGFTRTKEEQLEILARNAAYKVEQWILENGAWVGVDPIASGVSEAEEAAAAYEALTGEALPEDLAAQAQAQSAEASAAETE